ncbi:uncharacterized protein TRIADDRAFT_57866 [Trichoplax adhaerens]|uniref:PLAT domain-containing protein n=1 Tax=Trichoplax adhaerens TaxID=10228 RepID=B3S1S3_TRIAD|nr:hypothetical protein TRIADDRAFT_57866 [Trichoplax adhaerens]EDV23023.1 hypothetical protein TRIADDRAFT_57866 [Trichoplax adhaerens]|eukprot:XP_002113933.1 hypothetical protein TRIADDRAFT_57866 [Trichoplax adhaerens]
MDNKIATQYSSKIMIASVVILAIIQACAGIHPLPGTFTSTDKVCDPDPRLGCFSHQSPFDRILVPLPQSSRKIGVLFWLYTRFCSYQSIHYSNPYSISPSNFKGNKDTKIIVHGYLDDSSTYWMNDMKDKLLQLDDFNVILVDWSGSQLLLAGSRADYLLSVANTRIVGAQIGELIKALPVSRERIHIIGHSLGAHIASYAANRADLVGRITGLDPAAPLFQDMVTDIRLDKTDALFVDVIHTDTNPFIGIDGFGTKNPSGHVDFWPNGGESQPGCLKPLQKQLETKKIPTKLEKRDLEETLELTRNVVCCDHNRAQQLFTESIDKSCSLIAYPCNNYQDFLHGKCMKCNGKCASMGYHAIDYSHIHFKQRLFILTDPEKPYCAYNYAINIAESVGESEDDWFPMAPKIIFLKIYGNLAISADIKLERSVQIKSSDKQFIITSKENLGEIKRIDVWQDNNPLGIKWFIHTINIVGNQGTKTYKFCFKNWNKTDKATADALDKTVKC